MEMVFLLRAFKPWDACLYALRWGALHRIATNQSLETLLMVSDNVMGELHRPPLVTCEQSLEWVKEYQQMKRGAKLPAAR